MRDLDPNPTTSAAPLRLHWLVRLRWAAVAAQLASIVGVKFLLHAPFPMLPLVLIVGALVVANLALMRVLRRPNAISDRAIAANLVLDAAALTGLLVYTGGAMNPFTSLYFLEVALAAILVPRRWSLVVTICAVGFFGALLLARPEAIHVWHSAEMFMLHVRGMWVAFALTAACLWVFIERVSASLRRREDELAAARIAAERAARLSALGTLAAGTAHELNTPLGTVAILAAELSELLSTNPAARDQADRIRVEIRRCKEILARLRTRTPNDDERRPTTIVPWVEATVLDWCAAGEGRHVVVHATDHARTAECTIHVEGLRFALLNLLDNASIAAKNSANALVVEVTLDEGILAITVVDHGVGIATEHLDRLGEPFFTTREPGQGMGLGLFLVQAIASQHGGRMRAQSHDGVTRVGVELPAH